MRQFSFTLSGKMPLLMHADNILAADELTAWRKDPANKNLSTPGDDRSPPWTWSTYLYQDSGYVVMPAENIMVCLRQAGGQIKIKGNRTFKQTTQSGMFIADEFCQFLVDGQPLGTAFIADLMDEPFPQHIVAARDNGFELFMKRASVGSSKHVRVRPRFNKWSVTGKLTVSAPELTDEILSQLLDIAGNYGLCDWRPGCKTPGPYGMFTAKLKRC